MPAGTDRAASVAQEYEDAGMTHPFYNTDGTAVGSEPTTASTQPSTALAQGNDEGTGINNAPSTTAPTWAPSDELVPYKAPAAGSSYNAVPITERNITLNAATDTVAGQLDSILAEDSALMKRARNRADIRTNQAGLLGSSAMQRASMGAMIDKGFDIASQDAAGYLGARTKGAELSSTERMSSDRLNTEMGWREADRFQDQSQYESTQHFEGKWNRLDQKFESAESDEDRIMIGKWKMQDRNFQDKVFKATQELDWAELDASTASSYAAMLVSLSNNSTNAFTALANSPQASQAEADAITSRNDAAFESLANIYGYEFSY